jgi:hypothetical protein
VHELTVVITEKQVNVGYTVYVFMDLEVNSLLENFVPRVFHYELSERKHTVFAITTQENVAYSTLSHIYKRNVFNKLPFVNYLRLSEIKGSS